MIITDSIHYAWHSLIRNTRRTLITVFSVALGTFAMIILQGLMIGMVGQSINLFTQKFTGKVQAHTLAYLDEQSIYDTLPTTLIKNITEKGKQHNIIVAPRAYGGGLGSLKNESSGVLIMGVNPKIEKQGFTLYKNLISGRYLQNKANHEVVIGKKLANILRAKEGDKIVVIVQASDGSIGNDLYKVVGVLDSVGSGFDRTAFIIHKDDYNNVFSTPYPFVHELAANAKDKRDSNTIMQQLGGSQGTIVRTWQTLFPDLSASMKMVTQFTNVMVFIFGLAAIMGVLNTMLMAAKERVREFGVLESIGTSRFRLFLYTSIEGLLIGVSGLIIGMIISGIALLYLSNVGINLSSYVQDIHVSGMTMSSIWYAYITPRIFINTAVFIIIFSFLASLYPSLRIMRINVVKAIHTYD